MRDYIDITGKTEEEAIRKGLEQLGLDRDEVSVEILERAKAGFLGFGSAPAKIRLSYGEEKPEPAPVRTQPVPPAAEESGKRPDSPARKRRERREKPSKPSPDTGRKDGQSDASPAEVEDDRPAAPVVISADGEPKQASRKRGGGRPDRNRDRRKAEKPPRNAEKTPEDAEADSPPENAPQPPVPSPGAEVDDEKAQAIRQFLSGLLEHMDCPAEIRVYQPEEGRYRVILEGQGMGALIGRRGETLDAIQQLTNYSVNRNGNRVRIQLDAEGYREKREQSLRNLARKEAAKVVRYRRSRTLEPMNAYERHVIHTALQDVPGVNTYSTGVDPNRRVVIAYDREKT